MVWFVIGVVLVVVGLIVFIAKSLTKGDPDYDDDVKFRKTVLAVVGSVLLLFGGLAVFLNLFTITKPRTVDVPVEFGRPQAPLSPGWNWVKPWSDIETVDATVQTIARNTDIGRWNNEHVCTGVAVRLANNTTACVDLTGQWNIDQAAGGDASILWQRYRGNNNDLIKNLENNVVMRELQRAMNKAFEKYNPLAVLTEGGRDPSAPDTAALSAQVLRDLQLSVDKGIIVEKLTISMVHFDKVTQEKLDGYAQALADTQIATQSRLTAEQIRLANEQLAQSSATDDPGVMFQNCLNLIDRLASNGQLGSLPVNAVSCVVGGDGVPVIVNNSGQ